MNPTASRIQSRSRLASASLVLALLASVQSASAATYQWDPGLTPGTPSGGTGTWNTTNTNWSNGSSDVAWPNVAANDDKAVFGGSAGTVALGASLTAGGLVFNTSGYTLSGSGVDLTLNSQALGSDAFVVGTGVENISVSLRKLILTNGGSGNIGDLINLDKVNFGSTVVAISGSRQFTLTNSSSSATTTFTNFAGSSSTSTNGASLYLNVGNLTISNLASGSSASALAAASSTATNAGLAFRYNGTDSTQVGTLTLTGNNTLLNNAGTGTYGINFLNPHATYDIQHNNALGARDAANALTDTFVEFNGGKLTSSNGVRTLENAIIQTGAFAIQGANAITLGGSYTNSGGNRTLTNNNSAGLVFSGPVYLANDNTNARTWTLAGSGDTTISGAIANNNAGNTVASAFTITNSGVTTLTGANTYSGTTTVTSGTLALGANNAFSSASAYVLNGGTLSSGTFSATLGTLDLNANSSITLGSGGSFAFADSHLQDWGSFSLSVGGSFTSGSSLRFGSSNAGLTSGQLSLISIAGFTNIGLDTNGFLTASAVPEPSSFAALAGLVGMGFAASRRRRQTRGIGRVKTS